MASLFSTGKVFDFGLLKRVFSYAAPYKKQFILSIILAIVLAVVAPVRPWLVQVTVDKYIRNNLANLVILITVVQIGLLLAETALRFSFSFLRRGSVKRL